MNWFDFVIIAIVILAAIAGIRTGIIGAAFTTVGLIVGWFLASQFSNDVGDIVGFGATSDTWITVLSYIVIMALAVVVARLIGRMLRSVLTTATLGLAGMADRLGGLGLGAVFGIFVSSALIMGVARLAYDFEIPDLPSGGAAGRVAERIPLESLENTRASLEDALADSAFSSVFVDVADALPFDAFGFVPSDFKKSLEILGQRID